MKKMKLTGGIIVSALMLALSACGGQTAASTSDTSDTTVGSVTTAPDDNSWKSAATYTLADGSIDESNIDVAPETVEALEYIGERAPLLKNYYDKRNLIPLTYETTTTRADGEYKSNLYIKDSRHLVQYVKRPDGTETRVIYDLNKAYELDPAAKTAITQNCGEGTIVETVRAAIIYLEKEEAQQFSYDTAPETYEGTEYNCVTMTKNGEEGYVKYYFDKNSADLKYIVTPAETTRIDRFETTFTDDDLFVVPSDYKQIPISEVVGDIGSEVQSQIAESKAQEAAAE